MDAQLETPSKNENAVDPAAAEAFLGKAFGDLSGTLVTLCVALGDKYGLFKDLAAHGAQTSSELASCVGVNERYTREWAACLASAGYLTYDPATSKFGLPAAHAAVLAEEGGPFFLGGFYQQASALARVYEHVAEVFRTGGGVARATFSDDLWVGEERSNNMWHENLLVQKWIPSAPAAKRLLERGCEVADIGCGSGRALVRLGQAFPKSRFVGYDVHGPSIARANALAKREGVSDRVRFEVRDLGKGLPGKYDLVTAFDVVHDLPDPPAALRAVHSALRPGGTFLLLEINTADKLEDNHGMFPAAFFGVSVFFCMTIALSEGGLGYGTGGLPESRVREEAARAGFASVRKIPIGNPLNNLFELQG